MRYWLTDASGVPFEWLGGPHLVVLIIYMAGLAILLRWHKPIQTHSRIFQIIRWSFFGFLVFFEVIYHVWAIVNNIWLAGAFLPFHLCGAAGIVCAIALATYNKTLVQITYFIGLIPAMFAVVTPELIYDFPHFRFWKFFLHHCTISWASLFVIMTSRATVTWQTVLKVYTMLLAYAALVGFYLNPLLDANYLFLARATSADTPLNSLGSGVWYYVNLCLLTLAVFTGLWRLHAFIIQKKKPD